VELKRALDAAKQRAFGWDDRSVKRNGCGRGTPGSERIRKRATETEADHRDPSIGLRKPRQLIERHQQVLRPERVVKTRLELKSRV
jgi:hypothetical protein